MSFAYDLLKELLSAWKDGNRRVRVAIVTATVLTTIALIIGVLGNLVPFMKNITDAIAGILGIVAGAVALIVIGYQKFKEEAKKERKIEAVEKRVQENPKETQAAWELARVKLESYLDRNLKQIRSIFWLTVFVMLVGFSFIIFGIYKAFDMPTNLNPSVIASCSGVLVSFIGATFLVLYKSTMAQSTDYVNILERINAVGMSVQILETLDGAEAGKLKQETTAEIAKQLLFMYGTSTKKPTGKEKTT